MIDAVAVVYKQQDELEEVAFPYDLAIHLDLNESNTPLHLPTMDSNEGYA